jgi:hypothetical protein
MLDAGLHVLAPFVDKITFVRCLKAGLLDCPPQHVVTQDNVSLAGEHGCNASSFSDVIASRFTVDGAMIIKIVDTYKRCSCCVVLIVILMHLCLCQLLPRLST